MPESDASAGVPYCFVIAPIGGKGTEVRRRSDQILDFVIRPVVSEYGYRALRADEMPAPGLITSQVIQQVIDAPLVIADLTDHNPNVFYELALRHAFRKPVIQLIEADQMPPFDVVGLRTVFVDHHDLDSVEGCRQDLRKQLEGIQSGQEVESPISVAVDLQQLRRSDNPLETSTAEILENLAELRRMMNSLLRQDPMTYSVEQARQALDLRRMEADLRAKRARAMKRGGQALRDGREVLRDGSEAMPDAPEGSAIPSAPSASTPPRTTFSRDDEDPFAGEEPF